MTASPSFTDPGHEEIELGLTLLRQTVIDNPYIPIHPSEAQAYFLTAPVMEIMYGGAGGGGKSVALLAAALQYVTVPRYSALLLRRTFPDLNLPDGLIPLSHEWLNGTDAQWSEKYHQWTFPSTATLNFGYLENERDKYRYKGPSFQFIGFDELTGFSETQYRYLFQRLRKRRGLNVPLRMRSATNPGDIGHDWVKGRFIDGYSEDRLFVPARLEENPFIDLAGYELSLAQLDPVTRRQFRHGDWEVRPEGELFKHEWFAGRNVDSMPSDCRVVRYWDLAATKPKPGRDPDHAAGCKMGVRNGQFFVADMRHFRESPKVTEARVRDTADLDGPGVSIRIEQEPGSASKLYIDSLARSMPSFDVRGVASASDKVTRAKPASAACERGDVVIVRGDWVLGFLDELCAFPAVNHDDRVDAFSGAYNELAGASTLAVRMFGEPAPGPMTQEQASAVAQVTDERQWQTLDSDR